MKRITDKVTDLIGNTPLLELKNMAVKWVVMQRSLQK